MSKMDEIQKQIDQYAELMSATSYESYQQIKNPAPHEWISQSYIDAGNRAKPAVKIEQRKPPGPRPKTFFELLQERYTNQKSKLDFQNEINLQNQELKGASEGSSSYDSVKKCNEIIKDDL